MASIKQNPARPPLPDFRNFGVMLRILLGVNSLALLAALLLAGGISDWVRRFVDLAAWVQPLLLFNLALLAGVSPLLRRLPVVGGRVCVFALAALSAALFVDFWQFMGMDEGGWQRTLRAALLAAFAAATLLYYFHLRAKAFSPAVTEARLQALTARIRPHFLFNSLNGVLGVLRANPRRAEEALEELADLFRALMQENRDLVPLADEITLCERYLNLERLRLGERLDVRWNRDPRADEALVPPLFLQPLVENAVYHGIEPGAGPGTVSITIQRRGPQVLIEIANPVLDPLRHHAGNRMALDNIRERLMLFYDLEATLDTEHRADAYCVRIRLPFRCER